MTDSMRRKLAKCEALADDPRGDPHVAAAARRQAALLRAKLGALVIDWSKRSSSEALAAGVGEKTLCRDGWFIP